MDDDSSPCFAHTLVDGHVVDPQLRHDVAVFRSAERKRLYAMRKMQAVDARQSKAKELAGKLDVALGDVKNKTIGVYWPIRGELDLREWMTTCSNKGASIALPVIVCKNCPIEFHKWHPACKMKAGTWNIPIPAESEAVIPDIVVVPLLGVDEKQFRLGNGGGYYDRTLAVLSQDTVTIGVGQEFAKMKTIFPMPWDIPMKQVILV